MKKIIYLNFYCKNTLNNSPRACSLAGVNKADYVCQSLLNIGYDVEMVSSCVAANGEFLRAETVECSNGAKLKLFTSLKAKTKIGRALRRIFMKCSLFSYLIRRLKHGYKLMVYHSLYYCRLVQLVKWFTKCDLILEVEEIYSDVMKNAQGKRKKEIAFFQCADSFILSTELMNGKINKDNKPYVVCNGTYNISQRLVEEKIFDEKDKIHCVYAGTFDPRKGGATAAIAATEFLPSNYHVHILGRGSDFDTKVIKELISEVAGKSSAIVTYDGLLSGEEYIRFIQSCDIGLSTQNPDAAFNATSFPSKILSYMSNGLRVVSIRIPAIEGSAIGKYMYYYDRQTPQEIAKAIMAVNIRDDYDSRDIVSGLDTEFCRDIANLMEK